MTRSGVFREARKGNPNLKVKRVFTNSNGIFSEGMRSPNGDFDRQGRTVNFRSFCEQEHDIRLKKRFWFDKSQDSALL